MVGRHPDIGDDHVWVMLDDGLEQLGQGSARAHDQKVGLRGDQADQTLPDEEIVLGHDDPGSSHRSNVPAG